MLEEKTMKLNTDTSVLLESGEKDIQKLFEMLKENIPIPDDAVREAVLGLFTYILSM